MELFQLLALMSPLLALVIGGLLPLVTQASPREAARWTQIGATTALAVIGLAIADWVLEGGAFGPLAGIEAAGFGGGWRPFRFDVLSALMMAMIAVIGAVVARFGRRYLDRDSAQRPFSLWLAYTLGAILLLPMANNLFVLFAAWVMSSHGLHKLLTLYSERPAARMAAHKKFLISRLGDVMLLLAFLWMESEWGSVEFTAIFKAAASAVAAGDTHPVTGISLLIVLGAITKSAQFPFHSWLPDTMEAPTPVSALMHAGIINAGGFLLIRLSPLLALAPGALMALAFIGAISATMASLVMLTQNDVKRKLAFSTISQMGFMMLQCGLGAFSAAMLHIVGHSFYKAHAFLSAGSWVDPTGKAGQKAAKARPTSFAGLAAALVAGFALVFLASVVTGTDLSVKPGGWSLVSILAIALAQGLVLWAATPGTEPLAPKQLASALGVGAGLALAYLLGVAGMDGFLGDTIARPLLETSSPLTGPGAAIALIFLLAVLLQTFKPAKAEDSFWARTYVVLRNGFYWGEIQNAWIRRIAAPAPPKKSPTPARTPVHAG